MNDVDQPDARDRVESTCRPPADDTPLQASSPELMLISAPSKVMDYPCLTLPALTGHLVDRGLRVVQRDLSIEIKDRLLTEPELRLLMEGILPLMLRLNLNGRDTSDSLRQLQRLLHHCDRSHGLDEIENVKTFCQAREYYRLEDAHFMEMLSSLLSISKALDLLFSQVVLYTDLLGSLERRPAFLDQVEQLIDDIERLQPAVVGLSVITTQNAFSLWLASRVRERFDGYIVFGGSLPTEHAELYLRESPFIDLVALGPGESSLELLLERLRTGHAPEVSEIPGLVYRRGSEIRRSPDPRPGPSPFLSATPSYDGLPLESYLSPMLPIAASRGCPWQRCRFCAHEASHGSSYAWRAPQQVVDEMELLHQQHGTRLFHFADETIRAEHGAEIARLIEARGLPILWMSFSRLDDEHDAETLTAWRDGGARVLEWGLESGSQAVLDRMSKGIDISHAHDLLHQASRLGIKSKLLTWFNFPGETIDDLLATISFVERHVHSGSASPMLTLRNRLALQRGSELWQSAFGRRSSSSNGPFKKVWLPQSPYWINAGYVYENDQLIYKQEIVRQYIDEMRSYCDRHGIYVASNESISFDLVLCLLHEQDQTGQHEPQGGDRG